MVITRGRKAARSNNDASPKAQGGGEVEKPLGRSASLDKHAIKISDLKRLAKDWDEAKITKRQRDEADEADDESTAPWVNAARMKTKNSNRTKREPSRLPDPPLIEAPRLSALISKYGVHPLAHLSLTTQTRPAHPEILLAFALNALLKSAPKQTASMASDEKPYTTFETADGKLVLTSKVMASVIEAGYHNIKSLGSSTRNERIDVLSKGGYPCPEEGAHYLDRLADLIIHNYQCDLNNMLKQTDSTPSKIRETLKAVNGMDDAGINIFIETTQGIWPCLAPFLGPENATTARDIGLGSVDDLWREVHENPYTMCRLASALTTVRLEKREHEFLPENGQSVIPVRLKRVSKGVEVS